MKPTLKDSVSPRTVGQINHSSKKAPCIPTEMLAHTEKEKKVHQSFNASQRLDYEAIMLEQHNPMDRDMKPEHT